MSSAYALDAPYVGINYGQSEIDTEATNLTGSASLDEKDSGIKLYAGLNLDENFAIEAHYADFGEASLSGNSGDTFSIDGTTFGFTQNGVTVKTEVKSFGISGIYRLPVNDTITPFAKLGIHRWDAEGTMSSGDASVSVSDDGTDLFYGLGIAVSLSDEVTLRAEYERFNGDEDPIEYLSAGVSYQF